MTTLTISVVMACRNEKHHIRQVLDSMALQETAGMECEFIVADGMSDDGTRTILRQECRRRASFRVIDNPEKIVSTGLNAAIRQARGKIIVRMDAHTEYAPDYIRKCVQFLLSTGADNVGGPARTKAETMMERAVATAYHSPFACGGARFHDIDFEGWVDTVTYGCWHKTTLEQIGLFDPQLVRNQDDELNLRLVNAGGKIWQSPQIVSWYRPRGSLGLLFRQYFQYGYWKVAVIRKHRRPASLRHLVPGTFVLTLVTLIVGMLSATIAGLTGAALACAGLLAAVTAIYAAACLIAAVRTPKRHGHEVLKALPLVFVTYHLAYGSGFLVGLIRHATSRKSSGRSEYATELSR